VVDLFTELTEFRTSAIVEKVSGCPSREEERPEVPAEDFPPYLIRERSR
jgi:hypothetical protein